MVRVKKRKRTIRDEKEKNSGRREIMKQMNQEMTREVLAGLICRLGDIEVINEKS